jgi:hypothetical protein
VKYTRTTISIPKHVLEIGQARAARFRLSLSELIARLIEEEARAGRDTITIVAEEPPAYPPKADPLRKAGQQMAKIARAKKRAAKHQKKSAA